MKNRSLFALFISLGLGVLLADGTGLADDKRRENAETQLSADATSLKDDSGIQIDNMLARNTVNARQLKVHHDNHCEECHGVQNPDKPADDRNCLECHDSGEQVAQLTDHLEYNPHDSPHYGTEAACTACHREHSPSEVICYECHLFRFKDLN